MLDWLNGVVECWQRFSWFDWMPPHGYMNKWPRVPFTRSNGFLFKEKTARLEGHLRRLVVPRLAMEVGKWSTG